MVEILVVIAVVGILAAVAIPVVTGVPDAAKKDKLEQDVIVVNNMDAASAFALINKGGGVFQRDVGSYTDNVVVTAEPVGA